MATNAELSRLLAEVASTGNPSAEASRLVVEVVSDYVADEAALYANLENSNSFAGSLVDSNSAGVHELYVCVLSNLGLYPPPPPTSPGGGGGGGGGEPGPPGVGGGGGGGPVPPSPVTPPPGYSDLAEVVHEQYMMVLSPTKAIPPFRIGTQFLWI